MSRIFLRSLRHLASAVLVVTTLGAPAISQRSLLSPPVHGFLYMTGIKGDVTTAGHQGWHAIDGYHRMRSMVDYGRLSPSP